MLTKNQRTFLPVVTSVVFLNVVTSATAEEQAGKDVLEIYAGMSSLVFLWLPIVFVVAAQIFLTVNNSRTGSVSRVIGNWLGGSHADQGVPAERINGEKVAQQVKQPTVGNTSQKTQIAS